LTDTNRPAQILLVAGAALGLAAAMWSALGVNEAVGKYGDAIAVVDGAPMARTTYAQAIAGLASARRNPLTEAEKRQVLERIIDEELLLRRALELGLAESDPTSRKALVNATLQFSLTDAAKLEPSDEVLRAFYAERPRLIAAQPLLTVRAAAFARGDVNIAPMRAAIDEGQSFDAAAKTADAEPIMLPSGPIPPAKIAEYAGASVRDAALSLGEGKTAGPIEIGGRAVFVHVALRRESPPPPFEEVREIVIEEWRKREAERNLADYLARLRAQARITYAGDAPKQAQ